MEKRYTVVRTEGVPDWSAIDCQRVEVACWGTTYCPETTVRCAYVPGKTLYICMECREAQPLANCHEEDGTVWFDSCMEAFLAADRSGSYMNLECNSVGALRAGFGPGRHDRQRMADMAVPRPLLSCEKHDGDWTACLEVSAETLRGLWGMELVPGGKLYANFYKCGDKTEQPHFLSWSPIDLPQPNFHAPEFFGVLELL